MTFTPLHLFFDDVGIGQEWLSAGRTVTEADVVHFAGLSGDFNPIHVDHVFARTTPYGRPVAHGLLVWAISSGLAIQSPPMRTLALLNIRDWQFREPVYPGDTVRVASKVTALEPRARGRRGIITWERRILNQDNKVVQEGVSQTLVEGRSGRSEPASGEAKKTDST